MPALSPAEVSTRLAAIPDWQLKDGAICRDLMFSDFREAMSFVNSVAAVAERA